MNRRIVKKWTDYVLVHYYGSRYSLFLLDGEPVGPFIKAASDDDALEQCSAIVRQEWEQIHGKARSKSKEILNELESSNSSLLQGLDDDELLRFKNITFTWNDLSILEIERRRVEKEKGRK